MLSHLYGEINQQTTHQELTRVVDLTSQEQILTTSLLLNLMLEKNVCVVVNKIKEKGWLRRNEGKSNNFIFQEKNNTHLHKKEKVSSTHLFSIDLHRRFRMGWAGVDDVSDPLTKGFGSKGSNRNAEVKLL